MSPRLWRAVIAAALLAGVLGAVPAAAGDACLGMTVTILGTAGDDVLVGTAGPDVISGLAGADTIDGLGGDDVICGGGGGDTIDGGDGDDRVAGGPGDDVIDGGAGVDALGGGAGSDVLRGGSGRDILRGGGDDDVLNGGGQADRLEGGFGDDVLRGRRGNDLLLGGPGNDIGISGPGFDSCISTSRRDGCEGPTYLETFDLDPASPTPLTNSAAMSVSVNSRIGVTQDSLAAMDADHDTSCGPPPATHEITAYEDAVYRCRGHLMTAVSSGLFLDRTNMAVAAFSPNQILDFSGGPAVIRYEGSTLRASKRDWYDIWITPFRDLQRIPIQADRVLMQGPSDNAVVVGLRSFSTSGVFDASVFRNGAETEIPGTNLGYESVITPSKMTRSTFEVVIERDHLKVWMPDTGHVFIDEHIADLGFSRGVVQFVHNSYEVFECTDGCAAGPNTWHWDNIQLRPAEPMKALPADARFVNSGTASFVSFSEPAPPKAWVQFTAIGKELEVSFDGGATWKQAETQHGREIFIWRYRNHWMRVPRGATTMHVRGTDTAEHHWQFQDISIVAREDL